MPPLRGESGGEVLKPTLHGMMLTEILPHREDCDEWYRWLEGRGIPAAIVRMQGDTFAVFRKGTVVNMCAKGKYEKRKIREIESVRVLEVLASCNGYINGGAR
jgi:hypothetical protein